MSSGAQPSILLFPSGVDSFSTKMDRNIVISGEAHTIPLVPNYTFFLNYVPLQSNPSTISIPGYTEYSGTPASFQYNVTYSGANAGLLTFNQFQSGLTVNVNYTTYGDILESEYINSLQTAVQNVESFVLANIASGSFVAVSGGSVDGALTLNAGVVLASGNITTASSGVGTVGENGTPLATLFADEIQTNYVHSASPLTVSAINGDLTLSGNTILVSADLIPTTSGVFNIGSSSAPWNEIFVSNLGSDLTLASGVNVIVISSGSNSLGDVNYPLANIYADNIVSPSIASGLSGLFVQVAGDTMLGNLNVASGSYLNVWTLTNNSGDLLLSSVGNIVLNTDTVPSASGSINLGSSALPYDTLYVKNIDGGLLSGNFVRINGDTMLGDLSIVSGKSLNTSEINSLPIASGSLNISASVLDVNALADIRFRIFNIQKFEIASNGVYLSTNLYPNTSGLSIGDSQQPFENLYSNNAVIGMIGAGSNLSGVTLYDTNNLASGASLISQVSGSSFIGSPTNPIGTIYADSIVTTVSSGTYLVKTGDTLAGNFLTSASGVNSIGTQAVPLNAVWADNIEKRFVHNSGDKMTGPLSVPELYNPATLVVSGNLVEIFGQQIEAKSLNGALIIDGNSEVEILQNGVTKMTVTPSGILGFDTFSPNASGLYTLGLADKPWGKIYADAIITSVGGSGIFVSKYGDTMFGNLQMTSGANIIVSSSGINSLGQNGVPWGDLYVDRINGLPWSGGGSGPGVSGAYVHISGDTMTGGLTMASGASITLQGTNHNIHGTNGILIDTIFSDVVLKTVSTGYNSYSYAYAKEDEAGLHIVPIGGGQEAKIKTTYGNGINLNVSNIFFPDLYKSYIDLNGPLIKISASGTDMFSNPSGVMIMGGTNVIPEVSGTQDLGSPSLHWRNIYVDNITSSGINVSGVFVHISGDTMTGNLKMSGSSILTYTSGTNTIGVSGTPFSEVWTNKINGQTIPNSVYYEVPSGDIDNVNKTYTLAHTPVSGTQQIFLNGTLIMPSGFGIPTMDYGINGATINMYYAPTSGSSIVAFYKYY